MTFARLVTCLAAASFTAQEAFAQVLAGLRELQARAAA